jgi:uncharacterized membrane protein
MTALQSIFTYFLTIPIFFLIDMVWLGIISKGFYKTHLGYIMADKVNWLPAIIFYLAFIIGVIIFAVIPGIEKSSLIRTLILAALFGFFTYATYDLSNFATIKNWPAIVVIVDIVWGICITTITGGVGFIIAKYIIKV